MGSKLFMEENKEEISPKKESISETEENTKTKLNPWKFLLILLPAALSDSINPCAFAVILILL